MGCVVCGRIKKTAKYIACLIPGSLVICTLVYLYVVRQCHLITHQAFFWVLVSAAVLLSMLFSLMESALMTVNVARHLAVLEERTAHLTNQRQAWTHAEPSREYREERRDLIAEIEIVAEASERNAPIVVLNHLVTVLLGALLPITLRAGIPVEIDPCSALPWLGFNGCSLIVPGTGKTESLTFFSVSLLLILFGKIVPEKIGRKHNAWIIRNFRGLINWTYVLVGWVVRPMLALGDLFSFF